MHLMFICVFITNRRLTSYQLYNQRHTNVSSTVKFYTMDLRKCKSMFLYAKYRLGHYLWMRLLL